MSGRRRAIPFLRSSVLALAALIAGILVNEFHPEGIRWRVLRLSLPWSGDDGWAYVSADSAFFLFLESGADFIDVRDRIDFRIDHIQGAVSLPFNEDFTRAELRDGLDPKRPKILYALERESSSSRLVARHLARNPDSRVFVLRGGYIEWLDKSYPVEPGHE